MFHDRYEHRGVMAGQGTAALELFEDAGELDVLLVPVGGGGLIAGSSTVARALHPATRVVGVEPESGDDTLRSLRAGERVRIEVPRTIADGQAAEVPGELTFAVNSRGVDRGQRVGAVLSGGNVGAARSRDLTAPDQAFAQF